MKRIVILNTVSIELAHDNFVSVMVEPLMTIPAVRTKRYIGSYIISLSC